MKYIDTHAHLVGQYYKEDANKDISIAKSIGVEYIIVPGTTAKDTHEAIALAKKNKCIFAMAGIHPSDAIEGSSYLEDINPKDIIAVGEVGIDLYRDDNPPLEVQKQVFEDHINFAAKHNLPVVVHMRESEEHIYEVLSKYKGLKFLMHSYTSNIHWANKFIELGGMISISGIVTFKNAKELHEVVKAIPIEKMVVETDSPFLTPHPFRGKHNKPEYVKLVAEKIAELKEDNRVVERLYQNSIDFFKIKG